MSLMDTIGDPYVYNTQHWLNTTYGMMMIKLKRKTEKLVGQQFML